jgi:hypothetical protein
MVVPGDRACLPEQGYSPAEAENEAERFFMNVVLCRVLYTHAPGRRATHTLFAKPCGTT